PIKLPGTYQVRLALRDGSSTRLGSDSQFVEVPDSKKKQLTIAGLAVQRVDAVSRDTTSAGPAVRHFNAGDNLTYSYLIYGERRPAATGNADLSSQVRLFRAGKEVFTGKETAVTTSQTSSGGGIIALGSLRLGQDLTPGEYFLQIIVTDKLAPAEKQVSDQWIDFEVIR